MDHYGVWRTGLVFPVGGKILRTSTNLITSFQSVKDLFHLFAPRLEIPKMHYLSTMVGSNAALNHHVWRMFWNLPLHTLWESSLIILQVGMFSQFMQATRKFVIPIFIHKQFQTPPPLQRKPKKYRLRGNVQKFSGPPEISLADSLWPLPYFHLLSSQLMFYLLCFHVHFILVILVLCW